MPSSESFRDKLARVVFQRSFRRRDCSHLEGVEVTQVGGRECAGCLDEGTTTVHLRMCTSCGYLGCCDSSRARHARRHHVETGHPLIRSAEPGEEWMWCYLDKAYLAHAPD